MVIGTSTKPRGFHCLRPLGDARNRRRQGTRQADGAAVLARRQFEPRQRVINLGRRRHRVDDDVGLGEGQVLAAGQLAGDAARRGATTSPNMPSSAASSCGALAGSLGKRFFLSWPSGAFRSSDDKAPRPRESSRGSTSPAMTAHGKTGRPEGRPAGTCPQNPFSWGSGPSDWAGTPS
jgi:hypothetical protein